MLDEIKSLKPTKKERVFDLVERAGFDVSDWLRSASNPAKAKANPKYCYEWVFVQPDQVVIFNLWHDVMKQLDGQIVYEENFRANAAYHRLNGGRAQWSVRGDKLDAAVALAAREALPVRVIVLSGDRRDTEEPSPRSSRVHHRELDPSEWHVQAYNSETGAFILARGAATKQWVDQFDVVRSDELKTKLSMEKAFVRSPEVRRRALERAQGRCELCSQPGFQMSNGQVYLETHHVVRLADGGSDTLNNVVALCPDDHRRAHFAHDREAMRREMVRFLSDTHLAGK